jgi:hypothetical protein
MREVRRTILFFGFALMTLATFGQSKKFNAELSKKIDSMRNEDQSPMSIKNTDSAAKEFQKIIHSNFPVIKNIADKYGFPGFDLVGKESSNNYWLLVQHSDFDVAFQKRILKLMKPKVDKKNASGQNYAYLIDRINLNEGKQQIYGTQIIMGGNGTKLKPCIDTLNLDRRRLAVGLKPIKEYLKQCDEIFYEMNKDRIKPIENKTDATKKNNL